MNDDVEPICLPWGEKISDKVVGEQAYVVGWGATEFGERREIGHQSRQHNLNVYFKLF